MSDTLQKTINRTEGKTTNSHVLLLADDEG